MKYCEVVNLKVYPLFQDLEEDDWLPTLFPWVDALCIPLHKISFLNLVPKTSYKPLNLFLKFVLKYGKIYT